MVDVNEIENIFKTNFFIDGGHHIDPDTGIISVYGSVLIRKRMKEIPVQFDFVDGDFDCSYKGLHTLKGAPRNVGGDFKCNDNLLTNLNHSPVRVSGNFLCDQNWLTSLIGAPQEIKGKFNSSDNPLTTLEGAPRIVEQGFEITYRPHLPLLRLCQYADVAVWQAPESVEEILDKYAGGGRPGALKAAMELIRAGYRENARW